jgi:uncharacterized protein (TIRG00374 family)
MKLSIKSILKIVLPLSFGLGLVYFFYIKLSEENKQQIFESFLSANYWWLLASGIFAVFSQAFRAKRWQMLVESLGYDITFLKAFSAVSINYIINLVIPRAGEFARCGVIARYDNIPIQKSIGTLFNERAIDLLCLGIVGVLTFLLQYDVFMIFMKDYIFPVMDGFFSKLINLVIIGFIGLTLILIVYILYKKGKFKLNDKIKTFLSDLASGIFSIRYLKSPFWFGFHTLATWACYFVMIYLVFFTLPESSSLPLGATLSVLFFGTFGFIAVQGGLGVYPIIISYTLAMYGLGESYGFTLGWIMWIGQTFEVGATSLFSFIYLSTVEKKKESLLSNNEKEKA